MNIDQLTESLSENAPDPGRVLASVGRKRRAARNRMYAVSGGLAVAVVAVVAGAVLHGAATGSGNTAESSPASGAAAPAAAPFGRTAQNGVASGAGGSSSSSAGCGTARLRDELAEAVRKGASVIVGYGTLTSGSAAVHGAGGDAPAYYSLTLKSVQTLAGPKVASGSTAWLAGSSPAAGAGSGTASTQPLSFGPGGELFGIVSPPAASGAPGPVLQAAPVAHGQVVLSGAGCWDVTASGSHDAVNSSAQSRAPQSSAGAITEVPLAMAEKLAAPSGQPG